MYFIFYIFTEVKILIISLEICDIQHMKYMYNLFFKPKSKTVFIKQCKLLIII